MISVVVIVLLTNLYSKTAAAGTPTPGEIIITEIMMNPSAVGDADGEWFEIYNAATSTSDLMGCTFRDEGSNDFTFSESFSVTPESYVVLARNGDSSMNGGITPDYAYESFVLANNDDEIILTCNGQEIDRVAYDSALGFTIPEGASLKLDRLTADNDRSENWCESTVSYGDGDKGTPGHANSDCSSPAPEPEPEPVPQPTINQPPTAEAGEDMTAAPGEKLRFDASSSADPEGEPLKFLWDFGDGSTATSVQPIHHYDIANVYLVTLTVDDGNTARSDSLTVIIREQETTNLKGKLILNELLPNPEGSDLYEWIELYNTSREPINITGVYLADASKNTYIIDQDDFDSLTLPPGEFMLFYRQITKISLNNSGRETIDLYGEDDRLIDQTSYDGPAKSGWSWARAGDDWQWTAIPSPNTTNILMDATVSDDPEPHAVSSTEDIVIEKNSVETTTASACPKTDYYSVILNELWPSPQGDDRELEFIEIKNTGSKKINMCGWQLKDKGNTYTFAVDSVIPSGEFLVLTRSETKISLNNTGDRITLLDQNQKIVDETEYEKAPTDVSWSRYDDGWRWTEDVTPAEKNSEFTSAGKNKESAEKDNAASPAYFAIALADIGDQQADDELMVQGVVTAIPGILGSQIMYIGDTDGLQLYQYSKNWPRLQRGDIVKARGTLSFPYNNPRLKIARASDISILKKEQPHFTVQQILIDEISERDINSLIKISGAVIEKQNGKLFVDDGSGELPIYIKSSTGISLSDINEGDILEITGILDRTVSGYRLLPRSQDDIVPVRVMGYAAARPQPTIGDEDRFYRITDYLYLTAIALIIILSGLIYKLKKAHGYKTANQNH